MRDFELNLVALTIISDVFWAFILPNFFVL